MPPHGGIRAPAIAYISVAIGTKTMCPKTQCPQKRNVFVRPRRPHEDKNLSPRPSALCDRQLNATVSLLRRGSVRASHHRSVRKRDLHELAAIRSIPQRMDDQRD